MARASYCDCRFPYLGKTMKGRIIWADIPIKYRESDT